MVILSCASFSAHELNTTDVTEALFSTTKKQQRIEKQPDSESMATGEVVTSSSPPPKTDFIEYMTNWLRSNWIYPFPDDEELLQISNMFGTTATTVDNWLNNTRSRKWRPAIECAFLMSRPSELLLEDSINLFDGKPVRDIDVTLTVDDDEEEQPDFISEVSSISTNSYYQRDNENMQYDDDNYHNNRFGSNKINNSYHYDLNIQVQNKRMKVN